MGEHQKQIDEIDGLLNEYQVCAVCPTLVPTEKWLYQERRCLNCYTDYLAMQHRTLRFEEWAEANPVEANRRD